MDKKVDRRIRKTRSQIREALARLMMEKSVGEITVRALVEEADINRSTFYLHYSDIPGLLSEIEDDLMDELRHAVREHPISTKESTALYFIRDVFMIIDHNREIAAALTGENGDAGFIRRMEEFLEEHTRETLAEMFPEKKGEMKYFYSYCLRGCFGFVRKWLDDGGGITAEHAADLTYRMVVSSMRAFYDM